MTTEEKAKAYDEALESAKNVLRTDLHESGVWAIKHIFPQLAESEDEKIRKEIIDYLGLVGKGKCDYAQPMIDRWIAYLEKQKEQNVVPSRETILGIWELGNLWKENPEEREGLTQLQYIQKYWFEKNDYLKEQKHKFKVGDRVTNGECVYTIEQVDKKIREAQEWKPSNEQKSVGWSEEDERIRKVLIAFLEMNIGYFSCNGFTKYDIIQWLKSLPESFDLQPKQEWSEDDEKMVRFYEADYNNQIGDMPMIDVINMRLKFKNWLTNRLKFIRPQPQMLEDWTSEDDELLANVLGCIILVQTYKVCGDLKEFKMKYTGEELQSFVRSLKSRPRKQPHWKPSEQEKGALRTAIYILTNERNFPKAAAQLQNILDAFEGKESRKDWKPSEEQMEALKWLVEYVSPSEKYIVIVKNLYEQLKKFT